MAKPHATPGASKQARRISQKENPEAKATPTSQTVWQSTSEYHPSLEITPKRRYSKMSEDEGNLSGTGAGRKSKTRSQIRAAGSNMQEQRPFERKVYQVRTTTRRIRTGPYISYPDAELVFMTAQGDTSAFDELTMRYQNIAKNKALAVVRDFQAAEDVVQDAMVKAYKALKELQDPNKFQAWMLTIVQHTALDLVRARRENMSLETMQDQGFEAPRDTRGLQLEKMETREEDGKVLDALGELRPDYREIIVLKHVEKLSYKDIADRLNMTVSAVGEKLSRVRKLLEKRLSTERVSQNLDESE